MARSVTGFFVGCVFKGDYFIRVKLLTLRILVHALGQNTTSRHNRFLWFINNFERSSVTYPKLNAAMIPTSVIVFNFLFFFFVGATAVDQSCPVDVIIEKPGAQSTTQQLEYCKPNDSSIDVLALILTVCLVAGGSFYHWPHPPGNFPGRTCRELEVKPGSEKLVVWLVNCV